MVGYSRLMQQDEAGAFARLKAHRKELFEPEIEKHHGRVFKLMGDGLLAEFASSVDAVECAVVLQREMAERNNGLPEDQRIDIRMGLHMGDVIVEGSDLYGDGVNIAARLEGVADPGDILVSGTTYDHARKKVKAGFEDLGTQTLKNIAEPVRVYRVTGTPQASVAAPKPPTDKPSIAVLPFVNMSGDPEQEYFSDGLTEDVVTELSRFRNLLVVARNSSFTFKGQTIDVKEIGRKLGARYVVEGSVRKVGSRIRITAQLLESASGNHLWAERYDRNLEDIFAVQDELVRAISGVIPGQLDRYAVESLRGKPPDNLTAYDCELRGRWALNRWNEGLTIALEWFEKAIKVDPNYALAHAGLAMTYSYGLYVLGLPPETALARAKEHAQNAIALEDRNPTVYAYAAFTYHLAADYKLARNYADRAVSLNPNDPFVLYIQASTLCYAGGEPEQALEWFKKSERIEPYAPDDYRIDTLEDCYYTLGDYEKVIALQDVYRVPAYLKLVLAAALAQTGQLDKAKAAIEEYELKRPAGHDAATMIKYQMRMFFRQEDRDRWLEGYRKAGLPV